MGYFITFEGVEGCGKTTQIGLLSNHLKSLGYRVVSTREPGGCPIADKIRTILLDANNREMCSLTELLLYAAARAQHVSEVIQPALESGTVVLCDRFTDATVAYQSCGRGIERKIIDELAVMSCKSLVPDLTILLDCEARIGLKRAQSRIEATSGPREERFELEALEFHQLVRNGYLALAQQEPARFLKINGNDSIENISTVISSQVEKQLKDCSRVFR